MAQPFGDQRIRKDLPAGCPNLAILRVLFSVHTISTIMDRFQVAKKQSQVFRQFISRWVQQAGPSTSRPAFLTLGPSLGACFHHKIITDNTDQHFSHGQGSGHGRPSSLGALEGPSSVLAHQLPRNEGGVLSTKILPPRLLTTQTIMC